MIFVVVLSPQVIVQLLIVCPETMPIRFSVYSEPSLVELGPVMATCGGMLLHVTTTELAEIGPSSVVAVVVIV